MSRNVSQDASIVPLPEWERRKAFVNFNEEDAQLLSALRPAAEAAVDEIVAAMYRQFMQFDEPRAFFSDEATLHRVKRMQREYFLGLTGGEYGEQYLRDRLRIGRTHQRIGLSPRWYMGAYALYMQLAFPHVMAAFGGDHDKAHRAFLALLKIMTLDKELAITTYTAARERVIEQQAQEILEIATPVLRVWEGVLVAPLIGTLDTHRAQQFTERLLDAIVQNNSPMALIDITGVPAIDTATAQHLMETISAVRLLGAQVVLTGVRPVIAQTMVHLGIDLSAVSTRASLATGLKVALGLLDRHQAPAEARPGAAGEAY